MDYEIDRQIGRYKKCIMIVSLAVAIEMYAYEMVKFRFFIHY